MRFKIFLLLLFIVMDGYTQTTIKVSTSKKYQTIDNFGASDCWWAHKIGKLWTEANKDSLADLLFDTTKGIGLSAWRFNLGAGIDSAITNPWRTAETFQASLGKYDWSHNEGGQWFLQATKDRGVDQFVAFVNSPPRNMTRNGHSYCTDDLGSTNLKDSCYGYYAAYLADIVEHFKDSLGIDLNYISPVNEPEWTWSGTSQEGNRAGNDDIKEMVDSIFAELSRRNISSEIIIPESGSLSEWNSKVSDISTTYGETYGLYLTDLFSDSDVTDKVAKIMAGHSYWSDLLSSELVEARETLYKQFSQYRSLGYKYWQTEYSILEGPEGEGGNGRDTTITTAINVARVIHYDLTEAYASAWQWWLAVSIYDYKDGLIYTDCSPTDSLKQNIITSKTFWAMGNYSRFIRPGSRRIYCKGATNKTGLMASSYIDSASTNITTVIINAADEDKDVVFNFFDLDSLQSVETLTPYVTSDSTGDDLKAYPDFSVDSTFTVPAQSVVTVVGKIKVSGATGVEDEEEISNEFQLYQNYPNPFNPSTNIRYQVAAAADVTLKVYDVLGREVASLVNEQKAPGTYTVNFDGSSLSSGIYLYVLKTGGNIIAKKMMLVK